MVLFLFYIILFLVFFPFPLKDEPFGLFHILLVYLGALFWCLLFLVDNFSSLLIKKKKRRLIGLFRI